MSRILFRNHLSHDNDPDASAANEELELTSDLKSTGFDPVTVYEHYLAFIKERRGGRNCGND